jgi:hypothetical protein
MKKSIYKISEEYLEILHQLEETGGELTPELSNKLALNEVEFKDKAIAYIPVIKTVETDLKEIDAEIKRLQALKKTRGNIIKVMKESLKNGMLLHDVEEIKTSINRISFRKSVSTRIIDVEQLPNDCIIIEKKPIPASDLKKMIQSGRDIPGVELIENNNIQIK